MTNSYGRVVSIKPGKDKDGIDFKTVAYQEVMLIGKREVPTEKTGTRNLYPESYVRTVNGEEKTFKGSPNFLSIQVGDCFQGHLFTCDCTPFQLNGNTIRRWTGFIYSHENNLEVAARNLKNNNSAPKYINPETDEVEVFVLQPNTSKGPVKENADTLEP